MRGMLEAGAAGYLLKDEAPETIVAAVRAVARGGVLQSGGGGQSGCLGTQGVTRWADGAGGGGAKAGGGGAEQQGDRAGAQCECAHSGLSRGQYLGKTRSGLASRGSSVGKRDRDCPLRSQ